MRAVSLIERFRFFNCIYQNNQQAQAQLNKCDYVHLSPKRSLNCNNYICKVGALVLFSLTGFESGGQHWLLMGREDLRELPTVGRYCNPAVRQVLPEALLHAEIPWLVFVTALASGSWGLKTLVWCAGQDVHITGTSDTQVSPVSLRYPYGRGDGWKGGGKRRLCCAKSSLPNPTMDTTSAWPPGPSQNPWEHHCPCVTQTPGMLAMWRLLHLEHLWRMPKAHRQVPYLCQCFNLTSNQLESFQAALGRQVLVIKPHTFWKGKAGLALPSNKLHLCRSDVP